MGETSRPEVEADGIRAEALRRLKVRRMLQAPRAPTPGSSSSPSNTPAASGSPSSDKPSM